MFLLGTIGLVPAQNVGIDTSSPTRTLDINGNLRITNLQDKSNTPGTDFLLAANRQNGNVDYIDLKSLQQSNKNNMEVARSIYNATAADISKECSCGDIVVRFNGLKAEFKLKTTDVFTSNNVNSFNLSYGIKKFAGTAYSYADKTGVNFQTTTPTGATYYNKFRNLDDNDFGNSTIGIYTLVLPKQANLYRITLSRFNNTSTITTFGLICEKFYLQDAL